jgi:3'-phosphoadenosine 5'-phosphosulfate sulfotransferase (PAPS reductase)/FAD synthetase
MRDFSGINFGRLNQDRERRGRFTSIGTALKLALENEAIHVLREVAAQFERPVLLFSGGKDSIVLAWLARKAFHPAPSRFRSSTSTPATTFRRPSSSGTGSRKLGCAS